jgi:hypothetical protein
MAEGLVRQPRRQKKMEEVGDEYFRDLLSTSFFQSQVAMMNFCCA